MKLIKTQAAFLLCAHLCFAHNPILLIPGVGGSMLQTQNRQTIWVSIERFLKSWPNYKDWTGIFRDYTDDAFRQYVLGFYDGKGGMKSAFSHEKLLTPSSLFESDCAHNKTPGGLCGIAYLIDIPNAWRDSYINDGVDWLLRNQTVNYFGQLIDFLQEEGFSPGESLFGFPYDWRLSIRHAQTMRRLHQTLATISKNGRQKVTIISHSMGCLVTKYYLAAYPTQGAKFVEKWIAIGGPFQGAGGHALAQFFSGYTFGNVEICGCSARNLGVQSPSAFELLASAWLENALGPATLEIIHPGYSQKFTGIEQILDLLTQAYTGHTFTYRKTTLQWPLSTGARAFGKQTRELLQHQNSLPPGVQMYTLFGTNTDTPYGISYATTSENWEPSQLLCEEAGCPQDNCVDTLKGCIPTPHFVDGDGTVPTLSAKYPFGACHAGIIFHEAPGVSHQELLKDKADNFATILGWIRDNQDQSQNSPMCQFEYF